MAYYNANEVIRLTRKAMGLTQEQLCEGVCEIVTLSRIENGHNSVKRSTYRKLMEKMGRISETRYAICVSKEGVLAEDRLELERAFKRYDYEAAEGYLQQLKENADDNVLTRQYVARVEALIDYWNDRIKTEELVERLNCAMYLTVPVYEQYLYSKKIFPFTVTELLTLLSLANAYGRTKEMKRSIQLYEAVLRCLEAGYIGEPDKSKMEVTVRNNLSIVYEAQGENQKALEEISKCLEVAIQYDYGHVIATLLFAKAFNIMKLVEQGMGSEEHVIEAKKLSQQAYYLAAARGEDKIMMSVRNFSDKKFEKHE